MKKLKYNNESQFFTDFTNELKKYLSDNFNIEYNKRIDRKMLDIFLENINSGNTFMIEFKGKPEDTTLPPEIIPWLTQMKNKMDVPNKHFIVFSLANVNENVKSYFNQNNLEVFEYAKHKDNLIADFVKFIQNLELEQENTKVTE
jgi:hypothetical protein